MNKRVSVDASTWLAQSRVLVPAFTNQTTKMTFVLWP